MAKNVITPASAPYVLGDQHVVQYTFRLLRMGPLWRYNGGRNLTVIFT